MLAQSQQQQVKMQDYVLSAEQQNKDVTEEIQELYEKTLTLCLSFHKDMVSDRGSSHVSVLIQAFSQLCVACLRLLWTGVHEEQEGAAGQHWGEPAGSAAQQRQVEGAGRADIQRLATDQHRPEEHEEAEGQYRCFTLMKQNTGFQRTLEDSS